MQLRDALRRRRREQLATGRGGTGDDTITIADILVTSEKEFLVFMYYIGTFFFF